MFEHIHFEAQMNPKTQFRPVYIISTKLQMPIALSVNFGY